MRLGGPLPYVAGGRWTVQVSGVSSADSRELRRLHNFSPDGAIAKVAWALWRNVDEAALADVLRSLPSGAAEFWHVDPVDDIERRAAEWRALGAVQGVSETATGRLGRW